MKLTKKKLLIALIAFMFPMLIIDSNLTAEVDTEVSVGSGYQDNLFNDSNSTGDSYASIGVGLKYYPASFAELAGDFQYSGYSNYSDLSNLTGGLSYTVIPTAESSPLSVALSGGLSARRFGSQYELYDNIGGSVGADFGYRLSSRLFLNASGSYTNRSYTNSDYGSNSGVDISGGVNITVLGSNSLAFRMEYARQVFDQPLVIAGEAGLELGVDQVKSEALEVTGASFRYSRPLGERTGANFSIGYRRLHVESDYAALGYSIDYLSPWSNLWEGVSFSGGLKRIFPRGIVAGLAFSHYSKNYVDVVEADETANQLYLRESRDDLLSAVSLSVAKSFSLQNGKQITPSVNLGYRVNHSTIDFYDYEDLHGSVSVRLGL